MKLKSYRNNLTSIRKKLRKKRLQNRDKVINENRDSLKGTPVFLYLIDNK